MPGPEGDKLLGTSDFPVEDAFKFFTAHDLPVGLIVPTRVGMKKSIMDAHAGLRSFLLDAGIHDFSSQPKGESGRVLIEAVWIGPFDTRTVRVSLYRPETKDGDPRTWIYGLAGLATAGNLIAWFSVDDVLHLVNLSEPLVWEAREDPDSPLGEIVGWFRSAEDVAALELLDKIRLLSSRGWIPSGRSGDTGVGFTLESELGIAANSSRDPDYKGIELKAGRGTTGRTSLFSQTPNWTASHFSAAKPLLDAFGYPGPDGRLQLYCTNHARPNPLGLFMSVRDSEVHCLHTDGVIARRVIQWSLRSLETSLSKKHNSTFWVQADVCRDASGIEHFHYRSVVHTRAAISANLGPLIETGNVTLDLTLSERVGGGVRDHGYLFRIEKSRNGLLFPPSVRYDLAPKIPPLSS